MVRLRIKYFNSTLLVIVNGILSRVHDAIPLFVGDVLYAVMIYFMVRFALPKTKSLIAFSIAFALCFTIEIQQTIDTEWLVALRKTTLGHYVLGQGFLWSDLLYYAMGTIIASAFDMAAFGKRKKTYVTTFS